MPADPAPLRIKAFRVGPKNQRMKEAAGVEGPTEYDVVVASHLPLAELLASHRIEIAPEETRLIAENFPWPEERTVVRRFELFDFSFRSEYGRSGVDEEFVRDKLDFFKFRPATLPELICFASHFRQAYRDQWFESKKILALGSVLATDEVVKKKGWFSREVRGAFRYYPELECVAGRPRDLLRLSRTDQDRDGNWPKETLFLATPLA